MRASRWMIYGATGYTGRLLVEEAVKRGHQPIVAGRSLNKLRRLAEKYRLEYAAFSLNNVNTIAEAIADVDIVFHAAGPFVYTSDLMIRACLATKTHYLDITGEIPVLENTFGYDETARKVGVALISGVGFDVVPTDCLARYVADKVPGASTLEIAFKGLGRVSSGTAKSVLVLLAKGGLVRRDGILQTYPLGLGGRVVRMPIGEIEVIPIPWGDLATAYRTTRIPNITTYMAFPSKLARPTTYVAPLAQRLARNNTLRDTVSKAMGWVLRGPDEEHRITGHSFIWARAADRLGNSAEAWLETLEPYQFTAVAGVLAVEKTQAIQPVGTLSPALAFGADFVLDVEGTKRKDTL